MSAAEPAASKPALRFDVVAGLTAGAVVIPKALAYATIAGLPVQVGLYTTFVPMLVYAFLGTSKVLSVSTTTTLAILTGAAFAEGGAAADPARLLTELSTLTLLVGAILVVASLLRLGFVANFISEPVLVGFKAGIGVVIVFDQVPKLLGFHVSGKNFLQKLAATAGHIPETSLPTLAVSLVMIGILVGLHRFAPKAPAPLVAIAAGIGGAWLLGLKEKGVELVGHIPTGLPSLTLPDLSLAPELASAAVGIALMSFSETIAAARAFARSDEPSLKPNRELLATGAGNAAGALLGAMPAGGGTSQTAVNREAGARTQASEIVTAAASLATMLFLAPLIGLMPQATLAAVVVVYSIGLIKPVDFRSILKIRRTEFIWALAAFAGVMLFGTLKGILVAIVVSLVALAHQIADPPVHVLGRKRGTNIFRPRSDEHPDDESFPGLLLLRLEGRIFFANAERVGQKILARMAESHPKVVALDLSGVFDLEYTALQMLTRGEKRGRDEGVALWLVGLNPAVLSMVQRAPLGQILGRERMFFNEETAVAKYKTLT
ncbi:MAG TPA: SulP family inorganic anion transporter [Thermoanaerobaculia bacterium]|nr:SulP family inorganic anion transporter [Thermoanaerobaculia bacterium]